MSGSSMARVFAHTLPVATRQEQDMSFDEAPSADGYIVQHYQPLEPHEADALRHEMRRYHENRTRQRLTALAEFTRLERLWRIEAGA